MIDDVRIRYPFDSAQDGFYDRAVKSGERGGSQFMVCIAEPPTTFRSVEKT